MSRPRIVATRNATFQEWEALLTNRSKRNRTRAMVLQGVRPVSLALDACLPLRAVLETRGGTRSRWATTTVAAAVRAGAQPFLVAPELMRELGEKDEETPEVLLVASIPDDDLARLPTPADALLVALDRPTSPGNIGSVIRSVDALGGHGVVVVGHAADPYDPRAVRASTGSAVVVPTVRVPGVAAVLDRVADVRSAGLDLQVVGTDEEGDVDLWDVDLTRPTLLVTGNEHSGLSAAWRQACDVLARIPIGGQASSLNAANATTVLLYEAARQRGLRQPRGRSPLSVPLSERTRSARS